MSDYASLIRPTIIILYWLCYTTVNVIISQSLNSTNISESGITDDIDITLNIQPTADVTITIVPDGQITVNNNSLTFTTSNWDTAQTITITANDDDIVEDNHSSTISFSASDGGYDNAIFTVDDAETTNISVNIADNDIDPETVTYNLLITKIGNGIITGDNINCGTDCQYDFPDQTELSLIVIPDNDWIFDGWIGDCNSNGEVQINSDKNCTATFINPNVEISATTINLTEGMSSNSYSLWLSLPPTAPVTVTLSGESELVFEPASLTFDNSNWDTPQTVQLTYLNNDLAEGLQEYILSHVITSDDNNFNDLQIENIKIQVTDDDSPAIYLSTNNITVNENDINSYNITLNSQPTSDVIVSLTTSENTTLNPTTLIFTYNNWNIPQNITVSAHDDHLDETEHQHEPIHHQLSSDDPNYDNLIVSDITVKIIYIESVLFSTNNTDINKGETGNITVYLNTAPIQPITVNFIPEAGISVSPETLIFTASNLSQTIAITAIDDDLITNEIRTVRVTSNDNTIETLTINVTDNDIIEQIDLGPIILICQDCSIKNASLVDITSLPESIENYSFPTDLVTFELETSGTAHLDIYYKTINSLDDFVYRKYGPTTPGDNSTIAWYNLSSAGFEIVDNMVKVSLTLTDGQLGDDTGIDGIIVDDGGIAIQEPTTEPIAEPVIDEPITDELAAIAENLPEGVTLDEITLEEPEIAQSDDLTNICSINGICNVEEQTISQEVTVGSTGSLSNAIFEADVENQGMIGNSTIKEGVTLTGGSLTGTIINEGTIEDVTFVGSELSGGTLSGYIVNESLVGGVIKDVELAAGTVIKGGKIGGEINGDPTNPPVITDAEILPGTILTNVILSPTVEIAEDVTLGAGVIIPTEPYQPEDFGIDAEDIASLDAEEFSELEIEALATFVAEDVELIPPEALSELEPEQIAVMEGLDGLTEEQFAEIPVEALAGLTSDNMADFSDTVLDKFTPEHIDKLNSKEFKRMPSRNISKLFVNLNVASIKPKDIVKLLPEGWDINLETGEFTVPVGTEITPKNLQTPDNMPAIPDMDSGMGMGGAGTSLIESTTKSLEKENLTEFVLSQKENGILNVDGVGDSEGQQYAFIPDAENMIQVDTDEIPIGLSVGPGGFYTITTPAGQQYKVIPAPKDPGLLSEVTGSEIKIGKRGDVIIKPSNKTRSSESYEVMIFDPFVEPNIDDLCIEIFPGEFECDDNLRKRSTRAKTRKIQYPDGTAQVVRPTLLSPEVFIEEGLKFEGVQQIVYKADGTFAVLYQGKPYYIVPNFIVQNKRISKEIEPSIVPNEEGGITYNIAIEIETNTRSSESYEVLTFDPFLELAPDDLCIEIFPGEFECDF